MIVVPQLRLIVASDPIASALDLWLEAYRDALASGRRFAVGLAGGRTPEALYRRLAVEPLDWGRIEVFLGDERAVPPDDSQSNWGMIERVLLDPVSAPVENLYRPRGEADDLAAAAAEYARIMEGMLPMAASGAPVLDLLLLGLGSDGHTASLFPGSRALSVSDRWYVSAAGPSQVEPRLTITYPVIEAARAVCVLVFGESKAGILSQVLQGEPSLPAAPLRDWPNVIWLTDEEAAREVVTAPGLLDIERR